MTIALLFCNGQEAFFLHDLRITHNNGKQIDAMMKYASFGRRIGIFFAGDVATFKRLIPYIRTIEPQVNINNVVDPEGPLSKQIESYMMKNPDNLSGKRQVDLLGFIIDHKKKANQCFHVKAELSMGSIISQVKHNEVLVIGSGLGIPDVSLKITNIVNDALRRGADLDTCLNAARIHLKDIIQRCGASTYSKLGISPVFVGSILKRGYFKMIGEQTTGERFSSDFSPTGGVPPVSFDYSLYRKRGAIFLVDNVTKDKIMVDEAEFYKERPISELFDPEKLTQLFDPSIHASSNGVVYIINQWVIDERNIWRTIDKTYLTSKYICHPDHTRLADSIKKNKSINETRRYIRSGKYGIIVPPYLQVTFERDLSRNLFNHRWLLKHIQNYSELYR
ncbi:hypothetical protein [Paenibacillus chitinolyticus]|uniref:hypothetical protein n=1 Tax=Paenibacillus chitinolyticus TaxID=79263 RepID=UPI001C43EFF4|nr:hypothetical protein [Paenibacillus chitinolyticus]MBV6716569.1 hypothetical protein [Paenibacillus chitinolyticus]